MPEPEILNVAPEEAIAHFRAKGFDIAFAWQDTAAAEHLRAFTVSKAMSLDILTDIRRALDEAMARGETFASFRNRLEPLLRAKNWWGRQTMTDPLTGKTRLVQLGSPWRLRTIFDTNLRMSHAHGRWQRIERLKERMPFLRYVALLDGRTRPEHAAWHGTVLPVEHPFWRTHYPPNGWRCRCLVQQLSEDDLERYGFTISPDPPVRTRPWANKRTGELRHVPLGIDPGFDHNVGRVRLEKDAANRLITKLDAAPPDLARAAIGRPWQTPLFARHLAGALDADWPLAIVPEALRRAIGGQSPSVRLSGETAAKQTARHPDLAPADYARLQRILDEGEVFVEHGHRLMGFVEEDGHLWRTVVKATADGSETYLTTLHRAQPRDLTVARQRLRKVDREG